VRPNRTHAVRTAEDCAQQQLREGLPLRASIAIVGYTAKKPSSTPSHVSSNGVARQRVGFLEMPGDSDAARRIFDQDIEDHGFVMNVSRLWAYAPEVYESLFDLLGVLTRLGSLSLRQRGILIAAAASTLGDAYCSLAWGWRLADASSASFAGNVLRGVDDGLDDSERALAAWARQVVSDPNGATKSNVDVLRSVGFSDVQIFAITAYIAGRLAFSSVNDALGVQPDRQLAESAPPEIRDAVQYGRTPHDS
jgi:alkylhydroperoxidase family enzyme